MAAAVSLSRTQIRIQRFRIHWDDGVLGDVCGYVVEHLGNPGDISTDAEAG
ncbi:hypothetical protein [Streptacidiphilus carbonis]|uniref:hypothetical protein n=1 Tax=Streptacidiphilus carbonis TaxID=105422 RepID=UPI000A619A30|nr:hypothetical protein [Streptacidiphilus carbonis]